MTRSRTVVALAAALAAAGTLVAPASAAEAVHIVAQTSLEEASPFTSNLDGCEEGMVVNGRFSFAGTPMFGIFNGFKEFTCSDGTTFTIRLQATFDESGSTGTWAFVGGTYTGGGTLVGIPFDEGEGITDIYDGVLLP